MFQDTNLQSHLETSSSIKSQSFIVAEWNMNFSDNVDIVGNYRNRPLDPESSKFKRISASFDSQDTAGFYTGATDSDTVVNAGFQNGLSDANDQTPATFISKKQKEKLLFSLDECLGRFRPRSGINKLRLGINNNYTNSANVDMSSRPRYYMPDKRDQFKYWTSYRTEADSSGTENEYGISLERVNGKFYIDDAAPFVVYKDPVPANRIVVKMQTNVGSIDKGPFSGPFGSEPDPLYGYENQTTPVDWKIQCLDGDNNWSDAISFNAASLRSDGSRVIGSDGYVEIGYGLILPDEIKSSFKYYGELTSEDSLPPSPVQNSGYLVKTSETDRGILHYSADGIGYAQIIPEYGWQLVQDTEISNNFFVTKLYNADSFVDSGEIVYREMQYIRGIRIVATTMNRLNATLDLIEMSPRLTADISDMVTDYSINKTMSDLGVSGLPVGQLIASTGSLVLFDVDNVFNSLNIYSTVSKFTNRNLQIKFYEGIFDVDGTDYYVPIKTMYADGFPASNSVQRLINLQLRDLFFLFESFEAPQVFLTNVSLSYAISVLLDNIGFSNYTFKRLADDMDPIIPFFYVPPGKTVAEVLSELAISTQTAMFFDEYNNFVCMLKGYVLPESDSREADLVLYGSKQGTSSALENIIEVNSQDMNIYNDGNIDYNVSYIQKTYGSLKQAYVLDKDKKWIYKPALLWEVPADNNTKAINEDVSTQSGYVLSAIPLNSDLTDQVPSVVNHELINNVLDLGEAIYWIPRYNGYFYSNGEIIRFDAVEYSVPLYVDGSSATSNSNVWVSSVQEYQEYFSRLPFNGKIYPTGRVRIYTEPNYVVINDTTFLANGAVAKHGRGQFGTEIVNHYAGVNPYWTSASAVHGLIHPSPFDKNDVLEWPASAVIQTGKTAGKANAYASRSYRSGKIKNFLSNTYAQEVVTSSPESPETIQASAFILEGSGNISDYSSIPASASAIQKNPSTKNFVTYVHKDLNSKMTSFGTRIRVVGRIESGESNTQNAAGSMNYFTLSNANANQNPVVSGGSGGISVLLNPETNQGYYFEIAALSDGNIDEFNTNDIYNLVFYKVGAVSEIDLGMNENSVYVDDTWKQSQAEGQNATFAATEVLWKGLSNILVDDGRFTGQNRVLAEENTTVYDIAVEYEDFSSYRRFYLYLNGTQIATVDDQSPLPAYQSMAMFVRGTSKCMFENLYAISNNYSENPSVKVDAPISTAFGTSAISTSDAFRKYAISGMVQSTYMSGIYGSGRKYNIFYDEFGSIMREAAYFDIKFDKAYPSLYSKISPTFNKLKGYTVSGFQAGAYGAEFLIFNATDTALVLDETSGNYLRIQGVTFTQSGVKSLAVDEYFIKNSDLSNVDFVADDLVSSPLDAKKIYQDIKTSRITYGKKAFTIEAPYIQTYDAANSMMSWLMKRVTKPRLAVSASIFNNPMIQLGDIVSIYYKNNKTGNDEVASEDTKFVVYAIDHKKSPDSIDNILYLSEVPSA